jgi:hypothetical protein
MMSCTNAITLNLSVLLQSTSRDLQKKFPSEKRPAAILKMFCHLTGYSSYSDAYRGEKEEREFTPSYRVLF